MTARFIFNELLGKGSFGNVFSAERIEDKAKVTIKKIPLAQVYDTADPKIRTMPLEVALMKRVQHIPEVVKLIEFFMERGHLFVVMELIPGAMDLRAFTSKYGELDIEDAKDVFKQVLRAIIACHEAGVAHQDIKMANILVVRDTETGKLTAKLADFGMATYIKDSSTPADRYEKSAVWSLGFLLFRLVCKKFPNNGDKWEVKFPKGVPKSCQKLIKICLCSKPEKRPHLEDIKAHPWLANQKSQGNQKPCRTPCCCLERLLRKLRSLD
ncbi:serine/threonine-protein kinase pim-1-like [Oratosquilla oratoria]|uniref:serine/threonine-protein kinase pim-1-like n=1 Tax=Oratosquilla oratoria TaxID=337810 RepID=UPI003F75E162